jgi:hypothetical protein
MILLKELHCSLQEHHAHIPFIVIAVAGDLSPGDIEEIQTFAEYREVDDLFFPNYDSARYALNWMKLRVWGMDEYDGVLLIDSDITVHQDLTHLFDLPTDFAWAADQGANWTWNAGGFIFLRPCKPVLDHMVQLVLWHTPAHNLQRKSSHPGGRGWTDSRWRQAGGHPLRIWA